MATISTTTLLALRGLFEDTIRETVPVVQPQQADRWKIYRDPTDAATGTRRARVICNPGSIQRGGYYSPEAVETTATLAVRTDYSTTTADLQPLIQHDWHQLRERLAALTADPANGLVWIETTSSPPRQVAETDQGRRQIGSTALNSATTVQVDLTYDFRYFRARAA
jgi:hypothetical protein